MDLAAIIFGTAGTAAWIVVGFIVHGDVRIWTSIFAIECYVLTGGCAYQQKVWDKKQQQQQFLPTPSPTASPQSGANVTAAPPAPANWLIPGNKPDPPISLSQEMLDAGAQPPANAIRLYWGKAVTWTTAFPYYLIVQGDEDMMALEREGDGVVFSAKFFDADGKIVCEIVKSEIFLNKNHFRIEKSPTRIRVFNDEAKLVADVEYLNQHSIRVTGEFYLRHGFLLKITDDTLYLGNIRFTGGVFQVVGGPHPTCILVDPPENRAFGAAFVANSRSQAKEQTPEDIAKAAQRAVFEPENVPVILTPTESATSVVFQLKNIGQTRATVISAGVDALIAPIQTIPPSINPKHPANGEIQLAPLNIPIGPGEVLIVPVTDFQASGREAGEYERVFVRAKIVFVDSWGEQFEQAYIYEKQADKPKASEPSQFMRIDPKAGPMSVKKK